MRNVTVTLDEGTARWAPMEAAKREISLSAFLLSEDLQAGQDLDGEVVVDPFAVRPEELAGR